MASDPALSAFTRTVDGVHVRLRLTPKAAANRITGLHKNEQGQAVLKAQVTTAPEGGKANAALVKMLAREWKLAKSSIEVIHGATDRNKTLLVTGDAEQVLKYLQDWVARKLES